MSTTTQRLVFFASDEIISMKILNIYIIVKFHYWFKLWIDVFVFVSLQDWIVDSLHLLDSPWDFSYGLFSLLNG